MSLWSSVWWLFTVLLVVLSFEGLLTKGEAWSSSLPRGQQILPNSQGGGLLMAFPEGKKESKLLFDQCHPLVNPSRGIIKVEKSLSQKKVMSEWEDTTTRRLMHAPSLSLFAELNYKRGEINFIKKVVWVLKRSTSQLEIFHTSPSPLKCNKKLVICTMITLLQIFGLIKCKP